MVTAVPVVVVIAAAAVSYELSLCLVDQSRRLAGGDKGPSLSVLAPSVPHLSPRPDAVPVSAHAVALLLWAARRQFQRGSRWMMRRLGATRGEDGVFRFTARVGEAARCFFVRFRVS